ncbi:sigma 54-interacting transcriptional regulator, partial [Candidatus Sumerlaeota bacterium]|nr:sigma 54-interacting transcriptional regulator [Candidatus Sumerlaeota bacterium]
LDEIGDTSESFQSKLLRALDSGQIEPVGQDRPVQVDVRILCATNKDLEKLVREGKFREDLFFRINVVHIRIPPLA